MKYINDLKIFYKSNNILLKKPAFLEDISINIIYNYLINKEKIYCYILNTSTLYDNILYLIKIKYFSKRSGIITFGIITFGLNERFK